MIIRSCHRRFIVGLLLSLCVLTQSNAAESETKSTASGTTKPAIFKDCDVCPEMITLEGSSFQMGTPAQPAESALTVTSEYPQHTVPIKSFAIGRFEITQAQWAAIVGTNISSFAGPGLPVESVAFEDVQEFLTKLSSKTGRQYRLPTEAEWEFAARCGSNTNYGFGDNTANLATYGWYAANADGKTHNAGQKLPNACGLHDMHGNVQEWTADCWKDNYADAPNDGRAITTGLCSLRTVRGGSWYDPAHKLRSASRQPQTNATRSRFTGFRVVRDQ